MLATSSLPRFCSFSQQNTRPPVLPGKPHAAAPLLARGNPSRGDGTEKGWAGCRARPKSSTKPGETFWFRASREEVTGFFRALFLPEMGRWSKYGIGPNGSILSSFLSAVSTSATSLQTTGPVNASLNYPQTFLQKNKNTPKKISSGLRVSLRYCRNVWWRRQRGVGIQPGTETASLFKN